MKLSMAYQEKSGCKAKKSSETKQLLKYRSSRSL